MKVTDKKEITESELHEIKEKARNIKERIELHWAHINKVRSNAERLWKKLCDIGETELAQKIAFRVSTHDASKFIGIEFENMHKMDHKDCGLIAAIQQHRLTNDHHPQYHVNGIKDMTREQIGEMVCDWAARSQEKGTDCRKWIKEIATQQFGFTVNSKIYKDIKFFVDLIFDPVFKKIKSN